MAMKDKYVIQQKIGEGSFGRIFQAAHKITGEKVAVKIINPFWLERQV